MRHGEYKQPGGKLVVVDFDVEDSLLRNVEVSGDFFLEPPEALSRITGALEGAASESAENDLAGLVAASVAEDELIGITPAGIAIAVRRALAGEEA
ncbi:MAG: biotin--protein ligase [Chloroflexota bacterium]